MNHDYLAAMFLFEQCTAEQLAWISAHSSEVAFAASATVFEQDTPADALWVLIEGSLQLFRVLNGRKVVLETSETPGSWAGWLPMFDQTPMTLAARTPVASRMLRIPAETVRYMLDQGFPIAQHLLAGMFNGVQNFEALSRQQEKMAALGKLSAGLAHELNNPAAAAQRAASQLGAVFAALTTHTVALAQANLSPEQMQAAEQMRQTLAEGSRTAQPLDALARSDREEHLAAWLEARGIDDAWAIAPQLTDAGAEQAWLEQAAAAIPTSALAATLRWLEATITAASLIETIGQSSNRIIELVQAVKSYSHMDQADMQQIDIHEGLEMTLKILQHKLQRGVTITRKYDRSLPTICAYGGELNQVWTNLIDNAIDAMEGHGSITITTRRDETCLMVEIADSGPGIPQDLQSRIFEPFFTTKPQGEGTGLGLDIAYRIVTQRHGGDIKLQSRPGDTRFQVWLPISTHPTE